MFIRLTRSKTSKNPTVQIVESYREGKKVRQKIVASLGVVKDNEDRQRLIHMGHALIAKLSGERNPQIALDSPDDEEVISEEQKVHPKNLIHIRNQASGFEEVFGELAKRVGFTDILSKIDKENAHEFSCQEIIQMLVRKRIEEPTSKRRSLYLEHQDKGALPCELHQVYRAMDTIEPFAHHFQSAAHNAALNLLGNIECYFYDATTLYFESVLQDEVREFGFSKDGRFNQVQIVLCLLVTDQGLPVGYEIFAGNTAETKTLKTALDNLRKRYNVVRATIVCDRGMLSKDNLEFAESSADMNYIIGEKLRGLSKDFEEVFLDKSAYKALGEENLIRDMAHPTRKEARLILVYSPSRARKDYQDRERLLKKLRKKLNPNSKPKAFISNAGVKKYVRTEGGTATLNLEAIAKEERWDGFFGIVTNHKTLPAEAALAQYRGLWQVEAAFRLTKHSLSARPIFHWTPKRIRAHILICFQALALERQLEIKLRAANLTTQNIHDALSQCQKVILQDRRTFRLFEIDSNKPPEAKQIYETLGLKWRKATRELPKPDGLVVSSVGRVKPEAIGITGF